jgi:triosephosphate isomerase
MYKTPAQAAGFAHELAAWSREGVPGVECVICAPFTSLPALAEALEGTAYAIGAQNMHWETEGAYTGEISGEMLKELGVSYVIIGHSERRAYFHETDEMVNRKARAALGHGLKPIICVGETLEEREAGRTMEVVRRQTEAALQGLNDWQMPLIVIAYEPVWAIGTGRTASAADAQEVIGGIRRQIADLFGAEAAERVRIQYGGSVKPGNIRELMAMPDIDGALVGGASLEPESFIQIVQGGQPA